MKVYVTGATGYLGSAIVEELLRRGHHVTGLVRSNAGAQTLARQGAAAWHGDITDAASVIAGMAEADAVIHTAFNHDFARYLENCAADGALLEAMAQALEGTNTILVGTSVTPATMPAPLSTEDIAANPSYPRSASEALLTGSTRGVRASVVRIPMSIHGPEDRQFIAELVKHARAKGVSAYVEKGANRWPAVHLLDAARLYCDVAEQGRTGVRYNAVADGGVPFRTIAEAIAAALGVPTASLASEEADAHFGWLSWFVQMDAPASSEATRAMTGWAPQELDLISSIATSGYFAQ